MRPLLRSLGPVLALASISFGCLPRGLARPPASAPGAPPALWGALAPGSWAVGFRQVMLRDRARAYPHPLAPHAERPLLVNVWYPVRDPGGTPMHVEDYLRVRGPGIPTEERPFADLLEKHVRTVFTRETTGREPLYLDATMADRLARMLAEPVLARRDPVAAPGRFPLVLAHPGLGGAFADNFVLYEYLASHGLTVVSSAFQDADAQDMGITWDAKTSIADLDEILRWAQQKLRPVAVGVLGHSYGAQAALIYAMEKRPIKAVVSLDSTIENGDPKAPWFKEGEVGVWLDRVDALPVPALLFSAPEAPVASFFEGLVVPIAAGSRSRSRITTTSSATAASCGHALDLPIPRRRPPPKPATGWWSRRRWPFCRAPWPANQTPSHGWTDCRRSCRGPACCTSRRGPV